MTKTDYLKPVADFLTQAGITFTAVLIGADCPPFCNDAVKQIDMDKVGVFPRRTHVHGKHYRCTFTRKPAEFVVEFWNSYYDEEFNWLKTQRHNWDVPTALFKSHGMKRHTKAGDKKTPTPYDVLCCVQKSDPGTFENFCSDFGYDIDSRRAEQTWRALVEESSRATHFFTRPEIEKLQEIAV